eukprot:sb/3476604/
MLTAVFPVEGLRLIVGRDEALLDLDSPPPRPPCCGATGPVLPTYEVSPAVCLDLKGWSVQQSPADREWGNVKTFYFYRNSSDSASGTVTFISVELEGNVGTFCRILFMNEIRIRT